MIDLDELEKDLRTAGLLRHFKSGIATRLNHEEWAALSELTNAAPTLLALARAGRLMREAGANLRVCSAFRNTGSCGQCEAEWDKAETAFREADA